MISGKLNSIPIQASYWIQKLIDDVKENRDNIDFNRGGIADNADNLQDYFKDTMNFDAIRLIKNVRLDVPDGTQTHVSQTPDGPFPVIVEINGNEGYTCDTEGIVDLHTADKLCQKAGYDGAIRYFTLGERRTEPFIKRYYIYLNILKRHRHLKTIYH